jgi:predicted ThiF/HesA family dinucleotide-utilizing enzyme
MIRRNKDMHKLMRLLISFSVFFSLAGASIICAQDQQKLLEDEFLHQLFLSAKDGRTDKETLVKKINSLAKENFDQQYKGNVKNIDLEGIYELAKNCYVTCHTAQLTGGEEVFLFHAHIFGKFENNDVQIHGRGKEDMAEFGKFMMMSESGKIKFIRYFFKTYAKIELPL